MNSPIDPPIEQHIPDLVNALGSDKMLKRQRARLMLEHLDQASVPALVEALSSQNVHTRWEAVRALGEIRDPQTASALTQSLMDEDTGVRWAAMESLIRMGRHSLRPLLETFVKHFDSPWLREGAHHILRVFKDRHDLNEWEIALFKKLDQQIIGIEWSWTADQAWAAEKALEALDRETA